MSNWINFDWYDVGTQLIYGPIDRIESHNTGWVDAALREQFNVFGAKPEDLKKTKFQSTKNETLPKSWCSVVATIADIKTDEDIG